MAKTVLVLGASRVGLAVAHGLMKKTLPTLQDHKVVIVSPSTHYYWNVASVRAIVPGQLEDDKLFADIRPAFQTYNPETFEFILGSATKLDPAQKTVTITTAEGERSQGYDILVVATGSRYPDTPWKLLPEGYEATKASLHETQVQVKNAKSILLGGAGPTGVESAGELAYEFKDKEVFLATSAETILAGLMPEHIIKHAENGLNQLGVKILRKSKVVSYVKTASGQTEVVFESGEKKLVDLYIPTAGVVSNTEFMPKDLLNAKGEVVVNEHLRSKNNDSIWAAGDVVDIQPSQLIYAEEQVKALVKNLDLVLKGKAPVPYKVSNKPILAVTLGRDKGTGRMGNMKMLSLAVWFIKGRNMLTPRLPGIVAGTA